MSALGVYIGYSLSLGVFTFNVNVLYAMLAVFSISGASQAINDYFDLEIDKQKKSARPLASGLILRKNGFIFPMALFALGIVLASFLNSDAFWIAAFFSALSFLYSASMSKIKFVGNIVVSLSVGFTYIFGASVIGITPLVLMIAFAAFLANWAREIIKDVEDVKEDQGHKITLPLIMNAHQTQFIIFILLFFSIVSGYLPVFFAHANVFYPVLVTVSNIVFILAGKQLVDNRPTKAQSFMKKGMLVGLLAQLSLLV